MDFGDDDMEYKVTLLTPRGCNAFQIPPPATSRGHKAEDWKGKQIWKGQIQIIHVTKGDKNKWVIQLVNDDKTTFAESTVIDSYDKKIDRWYDSTRFFAILIENEKGQKANIGLGFTDRNDAFDFISWLDDYVRQLNRSKGVEKYNVSELDKEMFSKKPEKFELNIKGITDKPKKSKVGGGFKKLAPPPGSKKVAALINKKNDEPEQFEDNKDNHEDLLGGLESTEQAPSSGLLDF